MTKIIFLSAIPFLNFHLHQQTRGIAIAALKEK